jgi:DNA replication protein DnaC
MPVFQKSPPPEPKPCPTCGVMLDPVEVSYDYWKHPACKPCQKVDIKRWVASHAIDIMTYKGLPKRYSAASLADFPKGYPTKPPESGLFIEGPRGVGKSHLAAAFMRAEVLAWEPFEYERESGKLEISHYYFDPRHDDFEFNRYSYFPRFVAAPEMLLLIRSTFGRHEGPSESEVLEKYSEAPILFLDDLGSENPTDWVRSTLFILINRRYENNLKTYVTSNFSLGELAVHLDDRISSRLAEMCIGFKMTGDDRRLKRPA